MKKAPARRTAKKAVPAEESAPAKTSAPAAEPKKRGRKPGSKNTAKKAAGETKKKGTAAKEK